MRYSRPVVAAVLAILFALIVVPAAASDKPSNKWRMSFSGGADSDGHIELRLTPEGGEAQLVVIEVADGTSENHVAKTVVEGLKAQVSKEQYHVERDDGEDVLVKKRRGAPNFLLEVVANSVEGVRIKNKRK